jgi:hypothetical protein
MAAAVVMGFLKMRSPLAEDEVGRDDDGSALVPFSEEGEEDLDLVGRLLDVADVPCSAFPRPGRGRRREGTR